MDVTRVEIKLDFQKVSKPLCQLTSARDLPPQVLEGRVWVNLDGSAGD